MSIMFDQFVRLRKVQTNAFRILSFEKEFLGFPLMLIASSLSLVQLSSIFNFQRSAPPPAAYWSLSALVMAFSGEIRRPKGHIFSKAMIYARKEDATETQNLSTTSVIQESIAYEFINSILNDRCRMPRVGIFFANSKRFSMTLENPRKKLKCGFGMEMQR